MLDEGYFNQEQVDWVRDVVLMLDVAAHDYEGEIRYDETIVACNELLGTGQLDFSVWE